MILTQLAIGALLGTAKALPAPIPYAGHGPPAFPPIGLDNVLLETPASPSEVLLLTDSGANTIAQIVAVPTTEIPMTASDSGVMSTLTPYRIQPTGTGSAPNRAGTDTEAANTSSDLAPELTSSGSVPSTARLVAPPSGTRTTEVATNTAISDLPTSVSLPSTEATISVTLSSTNSFASDMTTSTSASGAEPTGNTTKTYNSTAAFPYNKERIRGVNLGGWLLLEAWITPSIVDATGVEEIKDEYTFSTLQDRATAEKALRSHWETFITEKDFEEIAAAGLNHVRIPIGYWAYDLREGDGYITGQDEYMERAVGWAQKHGVNIIIDLHGLPESQNGFDNSGRYGEAGWADKQENVQRAVNVIFQIAQKYSQPEFADTVTSIEFVNEPAGYKGQHIVSATQELYLAAYEKARYPWAPASRDESGFLLVMADAFVGWEPWGEDFMPAANYTGLDMDYHHYEMFNFEQVKLTPAQHIQSTCSLRNRLGSAPRQAILGEWSVAFTDCATYLNTRGLGTRFEGTFPGSPGPVGNCSDFTGTGDTFTAEYKEHLAQYFAVQSVAAEEYGAGWIYWTWKEEGGAAEWSYKRGMELGWIPAVAGQHQYQLNDLCS